MATDTKPTMPTMSLEEWRAEALRRGNGNFMDVAFKCPACGNVATPRDFVALGDDPNAAPQECIGRAHNRKRTPGVTVHEWGKGRPCNWAAFGLLGTLNGGVKVRYPDGHEAAVFSFAEAGEDRADGRA